MTHFMAQCPNLFSSVPHQPPPHPPQAKVTLKSPHPPPTGPTYKPRVVSGPSNSKLKNRSSLLQHVLK